MWNINRIFSIELEPLLTLHCASVVILKKDLSVWSARARYHTEARWFSRITQKPTKNTYCTDSVFILQYYAILFPASFHSLCRPHSPSLGPWSPWNPNPAGSVKIDIDNIRKHGNENKSLLSENYRKRTNKEKRIKSITKFKVLNSLT